MATPDCIRSFDALPDSALISDRTVAVLLESSRATVWRWSREGRIPQPVKLGPNSSRWRVGPLRAALAKLTGAA